MYDTLMSPRISSLSLVGYFTSVPIDDFIQRCCQLSATIIGNPIISVACGDGALNTKESKVPLNQLEQCAKTAVAREKPWISAWYQPSGLNRYESYKITEYAWSLYFTSWTATHAERMSAIGYINFNLELCDKVTKRGLPDVAREFFASSATTEVVASGFGDIADFYETSLGLHYSETIVSWIHPRNHFNQYLWARAGPKRLEKIRGIYWANYFGRAIVARLGEPAALAAEYAAMNPKLDWERLRASPTLPPEMLAELEARAEQDLCHIYSDGSMLFLLTSDVSRFCFPYRGFSAGHPVLKRYEWLHTRLRAADLLL
jgi:hypothetical protein